MSKKILIVDDSSANILLIDNFLQSEGYEVVTCFTGREALDLLSTSKVDLILLDLMMPDIDGLQVLKTVRSTEATKDLPIIIISAVGEPEKIQEVKSYGISDYIIKPINFDVIFERVQKVIG